jgi:hypothetical protein
MIVQAHIAVERMFFDGALLTEWEDENIIAYRYKLPFFSDPHSVPQLILYDPRSLFDEGEQYPRGAFRASAPLLPASQGTYGDANAAGKFGLRQSRALADCGHIRLWHFDMMNPCARLLTFGVGERLLEAPSDAYSGVGHVTFHTCWR